MTYHYVNGHIGTEEETMISAFDLGLLRGYGVFDYAQLYSGIPFHLETHLMRLEKSAKGIGIELPMSLSEIEEAAWQVIEKNEPISAGLRFIISGGISSKDYLIPISSTSLLILFHPTKPYPQEIYEKGMKAITNTTLRPFPQVKSTCYVPAIMAMREASRRGFHDALYVNGEKGILEGTTCNAFFVKNGILITDDSDLIIKGVTRDVILKLAHDMPIEFRAMPLEEVSSCEEAFLTSSIKDCVPLVQIDDLLIGNGLPGPITARLRDRFRNYVQEELAQTKQLIGR